eukprot:337197-Prymnesium_polylepis.1
MHRHGGVLLGIEWRGGGPALGHSGDRITARITIRAAQTQSARRAGTAARPRIGSGGGGIRQRSNAAIFDTGRLLDGAAAGWLPDAARTGPRSGPQPDQHRLSGLGGPAQWRGSGSAAAAAAPGTQQRTSAPSRPAPGATGDPPCSAGLTVSLCALLVGRARVAVTPPPTHTHAHTHARQRTSSRSRLTIPALDLGPRSRLPISDPDPGPRSRLSISAPGLRAPGRVAIPAWAWLPPVSDPRSVPAG